MDFTRQSPSKSEAMSRITETKGDLFQAPPNSILMHACNCMGQWGGGIATAFRSKYPAAYEVYRSHCQRAEKMESLLGTALLIPPQEGDYKGKPNRRHWIACLFTSVGVGFTQSSQAKILDATAKSGLSLKCEMAEVQRDIESAKTHGGADGADVGTEGFGDLYACRINSGIFMVPWEKTKEVLERLRMKMTVVESD